MLENKSTQAETENLLCHTQAVMTQYKEKANLNEQIIEAVYNALIAVDKEYFNAAFEIHHTLIDILTFLSDREINQLFHKQFPNSAGAGRHLKSLLHLFICLQEDSYQEELDVFAVNNFYTGLDNEHLQNLKNRYSRKLAFIQNK